MLEAADPVGQRLAKALRGLSPPADGEVDAFALAAKPKAFVLALLAAQHPEKRADFAAAARRLNVERSYPYHLIQHATQPH